MAGGKESAPLDCYVRVEPPRAEQAAILENEVRSLLRHPIDTRQQLACTGRLPLMRQLTSPRCLFSAALEPTAGLRAGSHHNARQNPQLHLLCDGAPHGELQLTAGYELAGVLALWPALTRA